MEPAIPMKRHMKDAAVDHSAAKLSESDEEGVRNLDMATVNRTSEHKLLLKLDLHIIPILALLFLLAFIDRINIGNARIQGLEKDLKMKGNDYNVALFVFFVPYILFEVPCNLILKRVAPSTWLSGIMFFWGIITICQGLTRSFGGLVACRVLLGFFEAGFVPGCVYLISMYYKRHELQWRMNLFFSASIIAGAFSGLLAYVIAHMDGVQGYGGWRWIFIIEGIVTVVVAVISKFVIVDWPNQAKFLNPEEREQLLSRLHEDTGRATMDRVDARSTKRVFGDWKIWVGVLMYLGVVNTGYSTSFFTPTILKQLGWTSIHAQVMSIPIYITATVFALGTAFATDSLRHRFGFTIAGCLVATIGYSILLCQRQVPVGARYMALYFITTGGYITQPVCIVWLNNNVGGHYKRAVAAALQIGLGNAGGLIASNIYFATEAPLYRTGFGVSLGLIWVCGLSCCGLFFGLWYENKKRRAGYRDSRYELPHAELENLGDGHPAFRYTY